MLIAKYFKPILIAVWENLEGILRTKGRDYGVIKYSLVIIAVISHTSTSFICISSAYIKSASFTLFIN